MVNLFSNRKSSIAIGVALFFSWQFASTTYFDPNGKDIPYQGVEIKTGIKWETAKDFSVYAGYEHESNPYIMSDRAGANKLVGGFRKEIQLW